MEMEVDGSPDLADFMNDWFFGTVNARRGGGSGGGAAYDLTGESSGGGGGGSSRRAAPAEKKQQGKSGGGGSSASKQTQEWLEEAKRMVGAGSPGRMGGSPSRQVPRFAGGSGTEPSPALDRRDPMSRSARRNRQLGGIGDEILQRASISSSPPRAEPSAAYSAPSSPTPSLPPNPHSSSHSRRKSRFHGTTAAPDPDPSSHRRTASSTFTSTSSSPAHRHLPHHRRHASASSAPAVDGFEDGGGVAGLNSFLRRQRAAVADLAARTRRRPGSRTTKLVICDASKNLGSILAGICYAWTLSSKDDGQAAVPVVNIDRDKMAGCKKVAWILYHVGVDASALLFSNEVDVAGLIMEQQASLVVVGKDVLQLNNEVGSACTILSNDYCGNASSLLQSLDIKELLLAGILLDTDNLSKKKCSNRDSEAVQLLLFSTSEFNRHELYQQLILEHKDHSFAEYFKSTYSKSSTNGDGDTPPDQKHSVSASGSSQDAKKSNSNNQRPVRGNGGKASDEAPRGKNKFFLAKWFGFGPK